MNLSNARMSSNLSFIVEQESTSEKNSENTSVHMNSGVLLDIIQKDWLSGITLLFISLGSVRLFNIF